MTTCTYTDLADFADKLDNIMLAVMQQNAMLQDINARLILLEYDAMMSNYTINTSINETNARMTDIIKLISSLANRCM